MTDNRHTSTDEFPVVYLYPTPESAAEMAIEEKEFPIKLRYIPLLLTLYMLAVIVVVALVVL
jgi:hypothetical protein